MDPTFVIELELATRRIQIRFEVIPAEPEVGLFSEGMEVVSVTALGGGPELEYADLAWAEGLSAAEVEHLVHDACRAQLREWADAQREPADAGTAPWHRDWSGGDALAGVA